MFIHCLYSACTLHMLMLMKWYGDVIIGPLCHAGENATPFRRGDVKDRTFFRVV